MIIILTLGTVFLLMRRLGMFDEYTRFRETLLLEEEIMCVYDDSLWEDHMGNFRKAHPHLASRYSMSMGRSLK